MLTCLVIGDPHFKANDMTGSLAMAEAIIKIAEQRRPNFIVVLGDTLDRHETIHVNPLTAATQWIFNLCKISPTYVLIGNHDRPNNSDFLSDRHPFCGLKGYEGLLIVDKVETRRIEGYDFFFVPYVPPGRFEEALLTNPDWDTKKNWTAGFTHQEFYGIEIAKGIFSDKGDRWPLDGPLLINGHIHDRSVPQPNIISIGTPRQHDFDESFDKAISLFTFTQNGFQEERIPVPIPKKLIVRLTANDFLTYQPPSPLIDYLKIEITGNRAELVTLRKLDKIKNFRSLGIKIVTKDSEAGQKKNREVPLPNSIWEKTPFRERLAHLVESDREVAEIYDRIFPRKKTKKLIIRKK